MSRDAAWMERLRRTLVDAGYTEEGVRGVRSEVEDDPGGQPDVAVYLRRLRDDVPLHTLVKLFVLDLGVPTAEAEAAFAPLALDGVAATGLLEVVGGVVRAAAALTIVDGLYVLSDHATAGLAGVAPDHVVGPGPSALALLRLAPQRPTGSVLDLGCGGGLHALAAARTASRVIGTDISPRCLNLAGFAAALNASVLGGAERIDLREGSWFEPVAGERFDLIVSNPPYVISPEQRHTYRDGGRAGDELCADLLRQAAGHLADGGIAVVMANWGVGPDDRWWTRAAGWAADLGCDVWVLRDGEVDPLSYAAIWNRGRTEPAYSTALDGWTAAAAELGMARIASGAVVLRRRSDGTHWLRTDGPPDFSQPLGPHLERVFAAEDLLAAPDADARLLAAPLRLAEDHVLDQSLSLREGDAHVLALRLRLPRGLRSQIEPDPRVMGLATALDGRTPLAEVLEGLAARWDVALASFHAEAVAAAARLLRLGLVEVAAAP